MDPYCAEAPAVKMFAFIGLNLHIKLQNVYNQSYSQDQCDFLWLQGSETSKDKVLRFAKGCITETNLDAARD